MPGNQVSKEGILRLKAMESTQDGFKLSEIDLEIRGPGDLMGIRQSGMPEFRLADLSQDQEIILAARNAAFDLIERDSELSTPENKAVKAFFLPYFNANKKFLGLS
jgi:ATP-dependent DNA helicase RecG